MKLYALTLSCDGIPRAWGKLLNRGFLSLAGPELLEKIMENKEIVDSKFMESMAGKQPFLKRMFTVFISQEPKRIQEIKDALKSQDVERLRHLAHALKAERATWGFDVLRNGALGLEMAAKAIGKASCWGKMVKISENPVGGVRFKNKKHKNVCK